MTVRTKTIATKYHNFNKFASAEYLPGQHSETQLMLMYKKAIEKSNPIILELGTKGLALGQSLTVFLQACEEKNGRLVSVDIQDCSELASSNRWQFVQSDSTDVEFVLSQAPYLREGIDILYIDSYHRREHVEAELTSWYPYLNQHAWIFFDDVDSHPYRKGNSQDSYVREVAWDEIHAYVQEFFYANSDSLFLDVLYGSTGLATLYKLSPKGTIPNAARLITHRRINLPDVLKYQPRLLLSAVKKRLLAS